MKCRYAANDHGKELMPCGAESPIDGPVRRQEAREMPEDDDEHAVVEQVRSEAKLSRA